jgi:hypothetical protein
MAAAEYLLREYEVTFSSLAPGAPTEGLEFLNQLAPIPGQFIDQVKTFLDSSGLMIIDLLYYAKKIITETKFPKKLQWAKECVSVLTAHVEKLVDLPNQIVHLFDPLVSTLTRIVEMLGDYTVNIYDTVENSLDICFFETFIKPILQVLPNIGPLPTSRPLSGTPPESLENPNAWNPLPVLEPYIKMALATFTAPLEAIRQILEPFRPIWDFVKSLLRLSPIKIIKSIGRIPSAFSKLLSFLMGLVNAFKNNFPLGFIELGRPIFESLLSSVSDSIANLPPNAPSDLKSLSANISNIFNGILEMIQTFLSGENVQEKLTHWLTIMGPSGGIIIQLYTFLKGTVFGAVKYLFAPIMAIIGAIMSFEEENDLIVGMSEPTNADPPDNLSAMQEFLAKGYGRIFNRMTMFNRLGILDRQSIYDELEDQMIDKEILIRILNEYVDLKTEDLYPERWMALPPDFYTYYYALRDMVGVEYTINSGQVFMSTSLLPTKPGGGSWTSSDFRQGGFKCMTSSGIAYASWEKGYGGAFILAKHYIDYIHALDPKMNFFDFYSFTVNGATYLNYTSQEQFDNDQRLLGLLEIADYCQSKGVKFGLDLQRTKNGLSFYSGILNATVLTNRPDTDYIYDLKPRIDGSYTCFSGIVGGYGTYPGISGEHGIIYGSYTENGPYVITYRNAGGPTSAHLGLLISGVLPEFRNMKITWDAVYSGEVINIKNMIANGFYSYLNVSETISGNHYWRSLVNDVGTRGASKEFALLYSGGNYIVYSGNNYNVASGILDPNWCGYRYEKIINTTDSKYINIRMTFDNINDYNWAKGEIPSGCLLIQNFIFSDYPDYSYQTSDGLWFCELSGLAVIPGKWHMKHMVNPNQTGHAYHRPEILEAAYQHIWSGVLNSPIGRHPAMIGVFREEDEDRTTQGYDYDYPSGTFPGEWFGRFHADMTDYLNRTWPGRYKNIFLFDDMFDPYHGGLKFGDNHNPGDRTCINPTGPYGSYPYYFTMTNPSGGFYNSIDFYKDQTLDRDMYLGNWTFLTTSASVSGNINWSDNTGLPWLLSIPLLDCCQYSQSGEMLDLQHGVKRAEYKLNTLTEKMLREKESSNCKGAIFYGWETPGYRMCPGGPTWSGIIFSSGLGYAYGAPEYWTPFVIKIRDATRALPGQLSSGITVEDHYNKGVE